jgi:hypothetical protein
VKGRFSLGLPTQKPRSDRFTRCVSPRRQRPCRSPLALLFISVLLRHWFREERAGRTLMLRNWLGNPTGPEPEAELLAEPNLPEAMDRPEPQPDPDKVPIAR